MRTKEPPVDPGDDHLGKAFNIIRNAYGRTLQTHGSTISNLKKELDARDALILSLRTGFAKEDVLVKDAISSNTILLKENERLKGELVRLRTVCGEYEAFKRTVMAAVTPTSMAATSSTTHLECSSGNDPSRSSLSHAKLYEDQDGAAESVGKLYKLARAGCEGIITRVQRKTRLATYQPTPAFRLTQSSMGKFFSGS